MARATMATLIQRVRDHIYDPVDDNALFTADQIEEVLDLWRLEVKQEWLCAVPTQSAAGETFLDFKSKYGDFEEGATLQDKVWAAIDAGDFTADYSRGVWTFNAQPNYPIYLTGWAYDHYGAAADLMDQKLAKMADLHDWSADGGSYKQSQMYANLNGVAGYLRSRQKGYGFHFVSTATMVRTDVAEFES